MNLMIKPIPVILWNTSMRCRLFQYSLSEKGTFMTARRLPWAAAALPLGRPAAAAVALPLGRPAAAVALSNERARVDR